MSKRKREDSQEVDIAQNEDQVLRIEVSRLKASISQSVNSLTSALKLARGFERQKMGRRQKQAVKDPKKLLRLREEVIILRELDLTKTAKNYLLKQMVRTKRINDSAIFQSLYGSELQLEGAKSTAEANVMGLLFKSSPVSQILPTLMQSIQDVLGLSQVSKSSLVRHGSGLPNATKNNDVATVSSASQEPFEGFSDSATYLQGVVENGPIDSLETSNSNSPNPRAKTSRRAHSDVSSSVSYSEDDVFVRQPGTEGSDVEMKETPVDRLREPSKATFLPSLSMGGYYSGSESDGPDFYEGRNDDIFPTQVRKNRRGQRERQKIAEKKYGSKAKHLQTAKQKRSRDEGWDARKGAIERDDKTKRQMYQPQRSHMNAKTSYTTSSGASSQKPTEFLHPSWEAARKKKKEHNNQMNAFAGKKIDFE